MLSFPWQQAHHFPFSASFVKEALLNLRVPAFFYSPSGELKGWLAAEPGEPVVWRGTPPQDFPREAETGCPGHEEDG